jgi:predicted nucleic acid-binding protein
VSNHTFVDTSVLVWVHDSQDARARRKVIERLAREQRTGSPVVSSNVLGELYVALTRLRGRRSKAPLLTRGEAAEAVSAAAAYQVVPVTGADVLAAVRLRDRHQMSFWDALNLASAVAGGCTRVLTCDAQSARVREGVAYQNPLEDN